MCFLADLRAGDDIVRQALRVLLDGRTDFGGCHQRQRIDAAPGLADALGDGERAAMEAVAGTGGQKARPASRVELACSIQFSHTSFPFLPGQLAAMKIRQAVSAGVADCAVGKVQAEGGAAACAAVIGRVPRAAQPAPPRRPRPAGRDLKAFSFRASLLGWSARLCRRFGKRRARGCGRRRKREMRQEQRDAGAITTLHW